MRFTSRKYAPNDERNVAVDTVCGCVPKVCVGGYRERLQCVLCINTAGAHKVPEQQHILVVEREQRNASFTNLAIFFGGQ